MPKRRRLPTYRRLWERAPKTGRVGEPRRYWPGSLQARNKGWWFRQFLLAKIFYDRLRGPRLRGPSNFATPRSGIMSSADRLPDLNSEPARRAPINGAAMNNRTCSSAWIAARVNPIARPPMPTGTPLCVTPRMQTRNRAPAVLAQRSTPTRSFAGQDEVKDRRPGDGAKNLGDHISHEILCGVAAMATMVSPKAAAMPNMSIEVAPVPMPPMTAAPQPIKTRANVRQRKPRNCVACLTVSQGLRGPGMLFGLEERPRESPPIRSYAGGSQLAATSNCRPPFAE
jgi:hypothetical protein